MDSVGTPIAVQQKLMRHSDIRTTMNVYGDLVDNRMKEAHSKVAALVFTSTAPEKGDPKSAKTWVLRRVPSSVA